MPALPRLGPSGHSSRLEVLGRFAEDLMPDAQNTNAHLFVLKVIALSFGSVSVISTMVTFYWFLRMRRTFRHDLIILLIQSDFLRSLWLVIFPINSFAKAGNHPSFAFCQVSGYCLTLGIEGADMAVFLIAVHFAMSVFRRRHSRSSSGLEPYCLYVYALWVLFPVLMASLVYLHPFGGFQNLGEYCYDPTSPVWYWVAFDWVPRYIIIFIIMSLYVSIYVHIRFLMCKYMVQSSGSNGSQREHQRRQASNVPPLRELEYHGLIPSTPSNVPTPSLPMRESLGFDYSYGIDLQTYTPSAEKMSPPSAFQVSHSAAGGKDRVAKSPGVSAAGETVQILQKVLTKTHHVTAATSAGLVQIPAPSNTAETVTGYQGGSRPTSCLWRPRLKRSQPSKRFRRPPRPGFCWPLLAICMPLTRNRRSRHRPPQAEADSPSSSPAPSTSSSDLTSGQLDGPNAGLAQTRRRIRQQLRLLFMYPLMYLVIWVCPFCLHILRFRSNFRDRDPFAALILNIFALSIAGTVNCALFMMREKPWRHVQAGFWASLASRLRFGHGGGAVNSGRLREEMVLDAIMARRRRDEEVLYELHDRYDRRVSGGSSGSQQRRRRRRGKGGRNWWDVFSLSHDGAGGTENGSEEGEQGAGGEESLDYPAGIGGRDRDGAAGVSTKPETLPIQEVEAGGKRNEECAMGNSTEACGTGGEIEEVRMGRPAHITVI